MGQGNRWQLNWWIASCWLPHFKIAFGISHFNIQQYLLRCSTSVAMPRFSTTHSCTLVDTMLRKVSSSVVKWTWTFEKLVFLSSTYQQQGLSSISAGVEITNQFFDAVYYKIAFPDVESWRRCEFQIQMIFSSKNSCLSICSHHHHFEVYISQREMLIRPLQNVRTTWWLRTSLKSLNGPYDLVLTL